MIVANNMSDNITVFDIDPQGRLHTSAQVAVRRPVFIAPNGNQA
jgi:6-phosphogluconolactonase (cycloisomerase 2 family)